MYLYHGSKQSFPKLRKHKAQAPPGRPPEEALYQINENCIVFIADGKGGHRDPPLRFRVIWY